jgi:hypothetical protein
MMNPPTPQAWKDLMMHSPHKLIGVVIVDTCLTSHREATTLHTFFYMQTGFHPCSQHTSAGATLGMLQPARRSLACRTKAWPDVTDRRLPAIVATVLQPSMALATAWPVAGLHIGRYGTTTRRPCLLTAQRRQGKASEVRLSCASSTTPPALVANSHAPAARPLASSSRNVLQESSGASAQVSR